MRTDGQVDGQANDQANRHEPAQQLKEDISIIAHPPNTAKIATASCSGCLEFGMQITPAAETI